MPPFILKPIFDHLTKTILTSRKLAVFPAGTFLENIAVGMDGDIFVTSVEDGIIYRIGLSGKTEMFASIPGKAVGIVRLNEDTFLVNGWNDQGVPTIYLIAGKDHARAMHQPEGAQFLNGMVHLSGDLYLICDSYKGCLWLYNLKENNSAIWLSGDLFMRGKSENTIPAANGLKIFNGHVYVSNTDKQLLLRIPLEGNHPGEPEVILRNVNLDDFAFDSLGNLYATTHIYNSVIKISPGLEMTILAEAAAGVVGSTAAAISKSLQGKESLFITTNGGMSMPPEGGLVESCVVEIEL
jgi:hypothetical protein